MNSDLSIPRPGIERATLDAPDSQLAGIERRTRLP